ncbi:MAG: ATP-dependent DNA ligase, partial [Ginsengibacter sp.]
MKENSVIAKSNKTSGLQMFAELVTELSSSTKTNDKLQSLVDYFATAPDADKVWVIAIFSGRRPRRAVNFRLMREWCLEIIDIPDWLFGECYSTVGDLSETLALLLSEVEIVNPQNENLGFYLEKFIHLEKEDESIKKKFIVESWQQMNSKEKFVFNKLITGSFRIGVSQKTIVNALAKTLDISPSVITHRISGNWDPSTTSFNELLGESASVTDFSKPYPFYLAYAIDDTVETLGDTNLWQAEWKWDGIRGQMIKRNNELFVWSRGEELMTEKFPEYFILKDLLPDGIVLDGEIIPAVDGKPLPFAVLQTRIGRKNISKKQLQDAPISFFVYDLLEYHYEDWREKPLSERRKKLEEIILPIQNKAIQLSPIIDFNSWNDLAAL